MGRTRTFDPDEVLEQSMRVFWRKGFEATSVDDIVTETGVNRASLYGTFGDKMDLFLKVFERYYREGVAAELDTATGKGEARKALEKLFNRLINRSNDGRFAGCMITNTVTEFGHREPQVLASTQKALALIENALDGLLRRARDHGDLDADVDPRARARALLATMQGMQVISKVNPDPKFLHQIADQAIDGAFR